MAAKEVDHSYVADQANWAQRVRSELSSAKDWQENWGVLFEDDNKSKDCSYEARIIELEAQLKATASSAGMKTTGNDYGCGNAFPTVGQAFNGRKKNKILMSAYGNT